MAALVPSNGVLTISNTSDTFTAPGDSVGHPFLPQAMNVYASAATHVVIQDADGITMLELGVAAAQSKELDNHYFVGLRPWKTPIKCSTLTAGGRVRIHV